MYRCHIDADHGLMVGLFSGTRNSDDDFERYLRSILDAHRRAVELGATLITLVLLVERNNPPPDARWRKRIADETAHLGTEGVLFLLCAESPLVRGVVTAINWIRPPRYEVEVVGTVAQVHEILRRRSPELVLAFIEAYDGLRAARD